MYGCLRNTQVLNSNVDTMGKVPYLSFDKSETNKRNNVELRVSKVHKACADG